MTENASTSESFSQQSKGPQLSGNLDDYGYNLFPDRKLPGGMSFQDWFWKRKSRENVELYKCEKKIVEVIKENPLIRIMVSALEKEGCPVNFRRHIQAEYCDPLVTGGYDPIMNQIVVCHNMARSKAIIASVLFHEMIHMYDYCTRELDFKNIDHLACTEIRAANLTYCSYASAFYGKDIDRTKMRHMHPECVKKRATDSVYAVRPISREEAEAAVERVFTKCYNDLEPIGRTLRRNSRCPDLAYSEAYLFGYD